jgi:hypothetical protein
MLALAVAEISAQVALMANRQGERPFQQIASVLGEVKRASPPVLRVVAAFEQAAVLQRVDEGDHATGGYLKALAKRLLRLTLGGPDGAQESELARLEV